MESIPAKEKERSDVSLIEVALQALPVEVQRGWRPRFTLGVKQGSPRPITMQ